MKSSVLYLCENTCIGVLLKKAEAASIQEHSFFPVKFVKFFRTAFF